MTAAALWDFDAHSGAVRMTGLRLCIHRLFCKSAHRGSPLPLRISHGGGFSESTRSCSYGPVKKAPPGREGADCRHNERTAPGMHEGAAAPSNAIRSGGVCAVRSGCKPLPVSFGVCPKGAREMMFIVPPSAARMRSRLAAKGQLFVAPQDLATFIAPSVICMLPSGKSQIASTPSSDSMNARDSS